MGIVWVILHPDASLQTIGEGLEHTVFSRKRLSYLPGLDSSELFCSGYFWALFLKKKKKKSFTKMNLGNQTCNSPGCA